MNIETKKVTIGELFEGFLDSGDNGVVGYGGRLNIRPAYQREFVYNEKQRNAVIESIRKGYPLNVMYWAKTPTGWEVLDGQQRTISICQYLAGEFSVLSQNGNPQYQHNLSVEELELFKSYELTIYECDGESNEKLEWFKVINIAGAVLTVQELRNAAYVGPWLSDAKRYFSKRNCAAYNLAKDYVKGDAIRQDFLETAIHWIAYRDGVSIENYMATHQDDEDAQELWIHFQDVVRWVQSRFPNYRKEMKGVEWGMLYEDFGDVNLNPNIVEDEVRILMMDEDVTKKAGIYPYILSRQERYLSIRAFTDNMKRETYERQNHQCLHCLGEGITKEWRLEEMEGDHITPWSQGGRTIADNCQMLCKAHNRLKSGR